MKQPTIMSRIEYNPLTSDDRDRGYTAGFRNGVFSVTMPTAESAEEFREHLASSKVEHRNERGRTFVFYSAPTKKAMRAMTRSLSALSSACVDMARARALAKRSAKSVAKYAW